MQTSQKKTWSSAIIYAIIGIIGYFIWIFNYKFITPLTLGLIIATLTYPVFNYTHKFLNQFKKFTISQSISAVVTLFFICSILSIFANITTQQLIHELPTFTTRIIDFTNKLPENTKIVNAAESIGISKEFLVQIVDNLNKQADQVAGLLGNGNSNTDEVFTQENINNAFNFGRQSINVVFNQLVYLIIFLLSWFNCLVYGESWLKKIFSLLPFEKLEALSIIDDFQSGVRNVVVANILSGLVHAIVCAIAMWIFGIQGIFILTVVIFFIGVLPLSPSELGYAIPVLLIFPTNPTFAFIFAIVGELIILWTNYILIPRIIASGKKGNTLLILTSIISGISIFGLMGFIIGPLIIIFIQTLFSILSNRIRTKEIL
ncbi:MAG: AI-2E family transporter [candidate division SR1 bacterium]|nr:AI-2E family transporter [candidate division SR1 bacterium]